MVGFPFPSQSTVVEASLQLPQSLFTQATTPGQADDTVYKLHLLAFRNGKFFPSTGNTSQLADGGKRRSVATPVIMAKIGESHRLFTLERVKRHNIMTYNVCSFRWHVCSCPEDPHQHHPATVCTRLRRCICLLECQPGWRSGRMEEGGLSHCGPSRQLHHHILQLFGKLWSPYGGLNFGSCSFCS